MTDPLSTAPQAATGRGCDPTRRRLVGTLLGAGLGAGLSAGMSGCAAPLTASARAPTPGRQVEILYLADTLECLGPTRIVAPATYLGPAELLGAAPWATAAGVTTLAGSAAAEWAALYTPQSAARRHTAGYGGLAARLDRLRRELGAERTLTLENGQCWSGSGLGHLANGSAGVAASRLLASDARVSSDERVLWPQRAAALYRDYARPVLGNLATPPAGVSAATRFERDGVQVVVVGASDPNALDETRPLDQWYQALAESVAKAAEGAELVVLLADTGSATARWLAARLPQVDLVLAARGQDFWPRLIAVDNAHGAPVPLCLPGSHASGCFHLSCRSTRDGWQIHAEFQRNDVTPNAAAADHQTRFDALRAPYAGWLDRPLGSAPDWLWRRDSVGGTWDGLIAAALTGESDTTRALLPGLRHDTLLAPGETITRDHLWRLSGGHPARVVDLAPDPDALARLLERALDNSLGTPLILNDSRDLPRLSATHWTLDYGAATGARAHLDALPGGITWRSFSARPQAGGEPLWQRLERYLGDHGGTPPAPTPPSLEARYVEGHPGWHPQARLST
ncbi:lipoprotein UxpA [Salinicola lusitanus]|uniref:lipoprotein UxpA n=1 Tax=Salinicola lusitanus TaxID=1949085 RepID=UPI0013007F87|nr:lipoprotein UxpA [Salinicola lusitanus]